MTFDTVRDAVQECMPGSKVMLFGSRARGDNDSNSDYELDMTKIPDS